jgi:uncharacterized protein YoxC
MSSQSTTGTTTTIGATFNTILRCLDAIEVKMEPLQPLQDQVAALETVVQDQATHQLELDGEVHRLAEAQSAQSAVRPQT